EGAELLTRESGVAEGPGKALGKDMDMHGAVVGRLAQERHLRDRQAQNAEQDQRRDQGPGELEGVVAAYLTRHRVVAPPEPEGGIDDRPSHEDDDQRRGNEHDVEEIADVLRRWTCGVE